MDALNFYLKHTKEMSFNDDSVSAAFHNVLFHRFFTVYVGSCCGSKQLRLYNLLVKMFIQDSVFIAVLC